MRRCWEARRAPWPDRIWLWIDKRGPTECWPWIASKDSYGYGTLSLKKKKFKATRVLWELVHGEAPGNREVMHACDNPGCCNPAHLSLGTHAENMRDMSLKKRAASTRGPKNGGMVVAVLDENKVRDIRREHANGGVTLQRIAAKYGVTAANVWCVVKRKSWDWVSDEAVSA